MGKGAEFHFPCRVFGINVNSATVTEEGHKDWKRAFDVWIRIDVGVKCPEDNYKLKGFAVLFALTCHASHF